MGEMGFRLAGGEFLLAAGAGNDKTLAVVIRFDSRLAMRTGVGVGPEKGFSALRAGNFLPGEIFFGFKQRRTMGACVLTHWGMICGENCNGLERKGVVAFELHPTTEKCFFLTRHDKKVRGGDRGIADWLGRRLGLRTDG